MSMRQNACVVEASGPAAFRDSVRDFRKSFRPQLQYGVGLGIQKGLPYLLIPLLVIFYGDRTYSSYVLFAASTLMFTNLTALAIPNAIIPFWYAEEDKRAVSWTFLLLLFGSQVVFSLFMALALFYIYGESFGFSTAAYLTVLGVTYAFLANFNVFLTGICRSRQRPMSFLIAQLIAGTVFVTGVVLLRGRQQLSVLISLFIVFVLIQDIYLVGSILPYLRDFRPRFDRGLARRVFRYALPLIPHLETVAFCFWVDKYLVKQYFTLKQFSHFTVSFQYAFAQSFFAQAFAMYTFPLFCQLVAEGGDTKLRSVVRTYDLIFVGLGTLWVAGLLILEGLGVPLRIDPEGFLILGVAFALWNVASNHINVLWARFKTPVVTVVMVGAGLILFVMLVLGSWAHDLTFCYLSHLGWAIVTLLGLLWLEHRHKVQSGEDPGVSKWSSRPSAFPEGL